MHKLMMAIKSLIMQILIFEYNVSIFKPCLNHFFYINKKIRGKKELITKYGFILTLSNLEC